MDKDERAAEVLAFIRQFFRDRGYAPSFREISKGCYMSTANVVRYLDVLEAHGRISRELGHPRSIRLLQDEPKK
jgi:SOS-response transcriptional repressor LexA